jgi:hypothetical protein
MTTTTPDRAWKLLEQTKWVQNVMARNANGNMVNLRSPLACAFCTVGAILKVSNHHPERADFTIYFNKLKSRLNIATIST